MKTVKKRIIVTVTNDLVSDNRVHKVCTTLGKMGFEVLLVGRILKKSQPLQRSYSTKRMRLLFNKGPLFYAEYNLRLFLFLTLAKSDILLSNDLDSLAANFLASRLRKKVLIYDSHEYFTEVPELINRPRVQKIWERIEAKILPKIKHAYTVCDSIANVYRDKYSVDFKVVRNLPQRTKLPLKAEKSDNRKMILYQGAVNIGRGLEQAIRAMHFIEDACLVIAGNGDILEELKRQVATENLAEKVEFAGRLPLEQLAKLTVQADLGLSIEEDLGLNYRFALPNKLFDYIQAQVPVLVSNLPEMASIVSKYKVGAITQSLEPEQLAKDIINALSNEKSRATWKQNLKTASEELVWEKEEKVLQEIFFPFR